MSRPQNAYCSKHACSRICFFRKGKLQRKNVQFSKWVFLIFRQCFLPFARRSNKTQHQGPFEDQRAHFGKARVVCVCVACHGVVDAVCHVCAPQKKKKNASGGKASLYPADRKTRHTPASAPRGRPTLCDTISPSERSLCKHRFVVDCGKPSVVAIFLLPVPAVAIFSMAKSSCADRTILAVKMLTNSWDLCQMWLWCVDVLSLAWVSCRCEMCKTLLFYSNFHSRRYFHQKEPKTDIVFFYFGLPFSVLRFLVKIHFYTKMPEIQRKQGVQNAKGSELAGHPVLETFTRRHHMCQERAEIGNVFALS